MTLAPAATPYFEPVELPDDPALPQLSTLFDSQWICQAFQELLPASYGEPERIRIHHFNHSIGRRALVSYEAFWPKDDYLPPEYFVATINRKSSIALNRFPMDNRLPGLAQASQPTDTLDLVNSHVLTMPARRARVQLIRYRPEFRAVLRHRIGRVRLFARVMRPADVDAFLETHRVAANSSFVIPGLAGCWQGGGIVWLTEVRGKDIRRRIRKGRPPDPMLLLECLESLWKAPQQHYHIPPFSLDGAYSRALKSFRHNLHDHADSLKLLNELDATLSSFVQSWQPTGMAHNDFYDDQLLVMANGSIALVDLEDIGPGDPMLDVGNFLAHLRWSTQSGNRDRAENCRAFHEVFRRAALKRFRWDARSLALREAVCLFRICTNIIRHPKPDWKQRLDAALALVLTCLD